ncbi:hypothetical protein [Metapseudomonas resinovorans]|uniref:hypothetical protein n=1 Tax=Metapseudomonas resinovorans TaxID=53412 RepID=UPI0012DD5815|nr:hypothetical protein [Pseudomonas resinovorans]
MAFLWLVLGYFQQGEELRLQANELKNSVEQQKELVGVTREQLSAEREVAREERERRIASIQPIFGFSELICQQSTSGECCFYGDVQNVGGSITELNVDIDSDHFALVQSHYPAVSNGQSFRLYIRLDDMANLFGFTGRFHFRDAEGGYSTQTFGFAPVPATPDRLATLRRVSPG